MFNKIYDDIFKTELVSKVLEVKEDNSLFWHRLNQTNFFVEKGGMTNDIGKIEEHDVIALKEIDGEVWHLLDVKLEGDVFLSVNLHERFRKAQVHTAQHLISALVCSIYNANVIAHHVNDESNDIEFDLKEFTNKQIKELQTSCNGLIRDDLKLKVSYPKKVEVLKHYKKKDVPNDARVVQIGNIDYNLCGCLHVPSLRYIQMISILGTEKTTNGIKIYYIAGDQLLDNLERRYKVLNEASISLALPHLYVNTGIEHLINDKKNLKNEVKELKYQIFKNILDNTINNDIWFTLDLNNFSPKDLHHMMSIYIKDEDKVAMFMSTDGKTISVVIGHHANQDVNANILIKNLFSLGFVGGGNSNIATANATYSDGLRDKAKKIFLEQKK